MTRRLSILLCIHRSNPRLARSARNMLGFWQSGFLVACGVVVHCAVAVAQPEAAPPPIPTASPPPGVYLDDSFEASDAITKAQKLISARQWHQAAELLQSTADSLGEKLIRTSDGTYVGIRAYIHQLIASWPSEGLNAYRELFEPDAERMRETVRKTPALDDDLLFFERYFVTSAAGRHADTLGQLALESADLALAESVYRQVLAAHPDASRHEATYGAMLALISAMSGTSPELTPEQAATRIRWMGEDKTLGDVVAAWNPTPLRDEAVATNWPTFNGGPARNRAASSNIDELGLLWRYDDNESKSSESDAERVPESAGGSALLQPVVSGDLIFVQRHRDIVALHRRTGIPAWRRRDDAIPSMTSAEVDEPPSGWDSVTVHDGRVYAYLPGDAMPYYGYESARIPPAMLCLDALSGRQIWSAEERIFMEEFSEITFDSSPLISRGRMYIVGRRRRSFGFEDCYLYRFNARTGAVEQRTHLGSASTGTFGLRRATMSVPAMHGDEVYVCTNLGTVAAVSARTGAVRWLRTYERERTGESVEANWAMRQLNSWAFNPVLWSDGRLIVRPLDTRGVFILDAADGTLSRTIPAEDLAGAETVLGVRGDLLCAAGVGVACFDLASGAVRWKAALTEGAGLAGRGAWVDDRLLIPTRHGLSAYAVADGAHQELGWGAEGRSGNILPLPEQLLVAADGSVSAYVRKADLWNSLTGRMAEAPSDPVPALDFAEVALRGGDYAKALTVLIEAVDRAGNFLQPLEPSLQRRLFDDMLLFAESFAARSVLSLDDLNKLYAFASQCPPDTEANLRYRLRFAELFERYEQPDQALRLYHQILRDRSLRELTIPRPLRSPGSNESAAAVAQSRTERLIERYGAGVYAPFATEAQRWLETGRAGKDLAMLVRVVESFPNSDAAPQALIAQGDLLLSSGRFEDAARVFARAHQRYARQVNRPELMRRSADALERAGRTADAYRWLTRAAREFPGELIEHEGRAVSFREYRDRLANVREQVEAPRPAMSLPLERHDTRVMPDGSTLLRPRFSDAPQPDRSRFYVQTPEGIRACAAQTSADLWPQPAPVRMEAELLVATPTLALFATAHEVFALDVISGTRLWSDGEYPARLGDPNADWEHAGAFRTHALGPDLLVSARDTGVTTAVNLSSGQRIWSQTLNPAPSGTMRMYDSWIVYHVVQDGRGAVCHLNAATGALLGTAVTDETRPIEDLFIALDGQVILSTSQSIAAYDLESGVRRWRLALDGQLRQSSLFLDIDALYLSENGRQVRKISLEDGRTLWQSEPIALRGEDLTIERESNSILATTSGTVAALDETNGAILWVGTTPGEVRFVNRTVTASYLAAVHVPEDAREQEAVAYFYDHRNASGVLAPRGGALPLGNLTDVRQVLLADDALVIQAGTTIHSWTP